MKHVLLLTFLFFLGLAGAQETERVMINGQITVPGGEDPDGISVINISSNRATISNARGEFRIPAAEGDTLDFRALQFENFMVVVDSGVIENRKLNVFISEAVTELPEVVVRPYDLSGNVRADVKIIPVADPDLPVMTAAEINQYEWDFRPDELTSPENAAMRTSLLRNGTDLARIFRSIFQERRALSRGGGSERDLPRMDDRLLDLYDNEFFIEYLDIKEEDIHEFIYFAEDNGLTPQMLEQENELELVRFLMEQSERYKEVKE